MYLGDVKEPAIGWRHFLAAENVRCPSPLTSGPLTLGPELERQNVEFAACVERYRNYRLMGATGALAVAAFSEGALRWIAGGTAGLLWLSTKQIEL